MKKFIKFILKLLIPPDLRRKMRALLNLPNRIDKLEEQNNSLAHELWKAKTLLLLKEQSPELLRRFASGLINDEKFIDSFPKTYIFNDLRNDFNRNMDVFLQKFICGAPDLSLDMIYKNQLNIAENPLYRYQAFSNIFQIFMPHYKNDEIAHKLDKLFDQSFLDKDAWGTTQYICWLLLRKEEAKAWEILNIYLKKHNLESVTGMIPIADLARRNGITGDAITVASQLFQTINNNVNNNVLENYIEGFGTNATIAIVGNGPHELGLGKGKEIDAHDIVVRFNRYNDSEEYAKDYGRKTNIVIFTSWAQNACMPELFNRSIDLFVTHSLYEEIFCRNIRQYYNDKPFSNITTIGLSPARKEIQEKYGINWPTSGFRAVYYLKNILKRQIGKNDVYGFALNHGTVVAGHYDDKAFGGSLENRQYHDFQMELLAMYDMFKVED